MLVTPGVNGYTELLCAHDWAEAYLTDLSQNLGTARFCGDHRAITRPGSASDRRRVTRRNDHTTSGRDSQVATGGHCLNAAAVSPAGRHTDCLHSGVLRATPLDTPKCWSPRAAR